MSNKKDKYKINYSTYISGGRAVGKSGSYTKGSTGINGAISGILSSMSGVGKNISKSSSSKNSSSTGIKGAISSAGSSISRFANGDGSRNSSESNTNLDYNVKKYMGQRGGTFGDKSYTKIGDDFYLKANPYSGIDMKKNNKPTLLKENQYNISEENREKINKGKIESYIKGINPYSAPPKNIRDAKAKESVESLMNNIQKRKNEQVKKQNEEYHKGISQAMSNYRPYGVDQRNTGKTQNNLLSSYPSYGSRVTKEDLAEINTALNQFAVNRNAKISNRIAEEKSKQAANKRNQAANATYKRGTSQAMSNFKYYGVDQRNTGKTQNNLLSSYPSYGSKVTKEDLADYSTELNQFAKNRQTNLAAKEAEKQKKQAANLANKKITSQVMSNFRPYGVDQRNTGKTQNNLLSSYPRYGSRVTKEDLAEFNTALNNYAVNRNAKIAKRLAEEKSRKEEEKKKKNNVGYFKKNVDHKENNMDNYGYQHISVPGQPTTKNFTKEHLGDAVPEYKDLTTKENEAIKVEKECKGDPNREEYIKKGESIESNNTNAGPKYDTNPMKAYENDSWYLKRGIEQDTRYKRGLDYMTQEEKDTANYLLGKYGPKVQAEYLNNILNRMDLRKRDEKYNDMKSLGPLQLMYYGFTNGMGEKIHDIAQGMSLTGGNENIIPDSRRSMAIEKKRSELTGIDKYLFDGPEWVGNNIITALASIFSPVVGIPLDATADYGSTYKKSMNGEYNIDEKGNTEIGEKNATKNMLHGLLLNLLFNQLSDVKSDDTYLKKLKDYIKTLPYYVILKDTLDKNDK